MSRLVDSSISIYEALENIKNGKYPWVKDLYFVYKGDLSEASREFVDFVRSPAGLAVIRQNGGAEPKKE